MNKLHFKPEPGPTANAESIQEIMARGADAPNAIVEKLVGVAHEVLAAVNGAEEAPFMIPSLATFGGQSVAACNCFYHTVLFLGKRAMVFTNHAGGMVPWITQGTVCVPDLDFFECMVNINPGVGKILNDSLNDVLANLDLTRPPDEIGEPDAPAHACSPA